MERAAVMARVSTEDQVKNTSLDAQVRDCSALAEKLGYLVTDDDVYREEGISGETIDRPLFNKVRDLVEQGYYSAVVWRERDRLCRELYLQLQIEKEFPIFGCKVLFVSDPDNDGSPESQLRSHFEGMFAQYEKAKIRKRTTDGMLNRINANKPPGGVVLYGYDRAVDSWVVNPQQASIVQMIYEWYADGKNLSQIRVKLKELGIPTPAGGGKGYWIKRILFRLLRNEAYIGKFYYNKRKRVRPKTKKNPDVSTRILKSSTVKRSEEDWILVTIPPIVDDILFQRVQAMHEENQRVYAPNVRRFYLLTGMIYCGLCGTRYTSVTTNTDKKSGGTPYYYCRARSIVPKCDAPYIRTEVLENAVWQGVIEVLSHPEKVLEVMHGKEYAQRDKRKKIQRSIGVYQKVLDSVNRDRQKFIDLYRIDMISLEQLKEQKMALDKRQQDADRELDLLKHQLEAEMVDSETITMVKRICGNAGTNLNTMLPEQRRDLLRKLGVRVYITGKEITLRGKFGDFTKINGQSIARVSVNWYWHVSIAA